MIWLWYAELRFEQSSSWRHSCVADRLPVVVRFPAGPRVGLKTVDPPKGNGLGQKKVNNPVASLFDNMLGMLERGITLILFVDAILTMSRTFNLCSCATFEIGQGIFL